MDHYTLDGQRAHLPDAILFVTKLALRHLAECVAFLPKRTLIIP